MKARLHRSVASLLCLAFGLSACAQTAVGGLRSARTICASPFPEDKGRVFYFGGFDAARGLHRGTASIYKGTLSNIRKNRP